MWSTLQGKNLLLEEQILSSHIGKSSKTENDTVIPAEGISIHHTADSDAILEVSGRNPIKWCQPHENIINLSNYNISCSDNDLE